MNGKYHSFKGLNIPPDLSNAVDEVCGIEKQCDQNWKIEPEKSIPFSKKETDPR